VPRGEEEGRPTPGQDRRRVAGPGRERSALVAAAILTAVRWTGRSGVSLAGALLVLYPDTRTGRRPARFWAEGGAGRTVLRGSTPWQPAPLLKLAIRPQSVRFEHDECDRACVRGTGPVRGSVAVAGHPGLVRHGVPDASGPGLLPDVQPG